jgi:DNA-binding FadR family transcriptional regulator
MNEELARLKKMIDKMNPLKNYICHISTFNVGDHIEGQHILVDIIGENLEQLREAAICLECFGYIERIHGKPTKILKDIKPLLEFIK